MRANSCPDPSHRRSKTGRCLDCLREQRKSWKSKPSPNPQRRGEVFQGAPCRVCASTERYVKTRNCTACVRARAEKQRRAAESYNVLDEFKRWIAAPPPESLNV